MKNFEETEAIDITQINTQKENAEPTKVEKLDLKKEEVKSYTLPEKEPSKNVVFNSKNDLEDIVKNNFQEKTIITPNIPNMRTIGLASDHRGFALKQKLTKYLEKKGYTVIDYGTDSKGTSDYPIYGFRLGEAIRDHEVLKGIAICGSGIGISMACNKVQGVRCAKVNNVKEVKWTCRDNDANVIALSSKTPTFRAKDIVDVFLKTNFSNLERHKKRIDMLNNYGE